LIVGAKADLRRPEPGANAPDDFAEDDYFGAARAGGFDPSERAVAFFARLWARVARALDLSRRFGFRSARPRRNESRGILPATTRDLRRAFSSDRLRELIWKDEKDEKEEKDETDASRASARSVSVPLNGGFRCCAIGGGADSALDLARFDEYFVELLKRRYDSERAPRRDEEADPFAAGGTVNGGFQFAAPSRGTASAFSFPGNTARATTATLRGGTAYGAAPNGKANTMWMGGDRTDAGEASVDF
jgi:hypothetical protein